LVVFPPGFFSVPLVGICGVQAARLPLLAGSDEVFFFLRLLVRADDLGSKKQIHYFLPTFIRFKHHLHPLLLTEVKSQMFPHPLFLFVTVLVGSEFCLSLSTY
jgi:hypothetical protein